MVSKDRRLARTFHRARILLYAHSHQDASNQDIANILACGRETVRRIRNRFLDNGLDSALHEHPRPGQPRKMSAKDEALVIATACTKAPDGTHHWTIKLLTERFRSKTRKQISREVIRLVLKRNQLKPWLKKCGVFLM